MAPPTLLDKEPDKVDDSNCNLSNIILSEGTIEFDSNITEYEIKVSDIDTLMVEPELSSNRATYMVDKKDDRVIIDVTAVDGTTKTYTLYINNEIIESNPKEEKNNYVPIFIGIICLLVLINIFRIVKNKKSKS